MELEYYAGIGSRETPRDVLQLMKRIAAELYLRGYVLRSDQDLDLMYGDASEFGKAMAAKIKKGLSTLHDVPKPKEGEERPYARSV